MPDSSHARDLWSLPMFLLWMVFLLMGLLPEPMFYVLRGLGGVVTQSALVNSPGLITVAFAAYVSAITFSSALDLKLPRIEAWVRSLTLALVALIAFLPYGYADWLSASDAITPAHRRALYALGPAKLAAWFFLISLGVRAYVFNERGAFAKAFWPATPRRQEPQSQEPASPAQAPASEAAPSQRAPSPTPAPPVEPEHPRTGA